MQVSILILELNKVDGMILNLLVMFSYISLEKDFLGKC
ncbi:hypothetical protein BVRB_1g022980 [Beta vulgaris subsp. vulgaris]|uniref:Uncharacterized protein n=1 Tax=Beta vulgaris subsp. vulgaris TaxID=3555 RepID=A0A0J8BHL3_BETVV|nr:hypothetical protein BVRB_1g022980 [Beta vulgaris subsp. vulgaris]